MLERIGLVLLALALAACSRAPGDAGAPKTLVDRTAGIAVRLPDTAAGSLATEPADHYLWSVEYAPNRTLLYFRVLDLQAGFLPLHLRNDVIAKIFQGERNGMLSTLSEEATAPDGSTVELIAGFDREDEGIAGFAWQGGHTTMAVFALTGPDVKPDRETAEAVLAELWPRLTLSPKDYGYETMMKSRIRYNADISRQDHGDNANIDAAYSLFAMRAHDPDNYREAIERLCAVLLFMDMRGEAESDVRTRALAALDSFSDILQRDQLFAREQFLYALGRRDRAAAADIARLLDAFDSPFDPDAKICSQARWARVRGL